MFVMNVDSNGDFNNVGNFIFIGKDFMLFVLMKIDFKCYFDLCETINSIDVAFFLLSCNYGFDRLHWSSITVV